MRDRVTSALVPFGRAPHVTAVGSPYQLPGRVSAGRHIAFATVQFDVKASKIPGSEATALMNDARAASGNGVSFYLGGDVVDQAQTPEGGSSEGIGVLAAAIVLRNTALRRPGDGRRSPPFVSFGEGRRSARRLRSPWWLPPPRAAHPRGAAWLPRAASRRPRHMITISRASCTPWHPPSSRRARTGLPRDMAAAWLASAEPAPPSCQSRPQKIPPGISTFG